MSYILNALRKSERERQALKPDSVNARIDVHQPLPPQRSIKLWIGLTLMLNVAVLGYFLIYQPTTETPVAEPANSPVKKIAEPAVKKLKPVAPPPIKAAELPANKPKPVLSPQVVAQSGLLKQPLAEIIQAPVVAKPVRIETQSLETNQLNAATSPSAKPVLNPEVKADWPFLDQLPNEFSRTVPSLAINVYAFTNEVADRFVMIDRVKYKVGQRINEELELKEIRVDSIVVNYNNRTFKIRRP